MAVQHTLIGGRQRTGHLLHEQVVRMRRQSDEVHTARGEINDKHRPGLLPFASAASFRYTARA